MADIAFVPRGPVRRSLVPVAQGLDGPVEDALQVAQHVDRLRREDGLSVQASLRALVERVQALEAITEPNLRVFARAYVSVVSGVLDEATSLFVNLSVSLASDLTAAFDVAPTSERYCVHVLNGSLQARSYAYSGETTSGFVVRQFDAAGAPISWSSGTFQASITVIGQ